MSSTFTYFFIFYIILYLIEIVLPGFVTNIISFNYILLPTLAFGILGILLPTKKTSVSEHPHSYLATFFFIFSLSIALAIILYYKLPIEAAYLKISLSLLFGLLPSLLVIIVSRRRLSYIDEPLVPVYTVKTVELSWSLMLRRLLLNQISLPVFPLILVLLFSLVFLPQRKAIVQSPSAVSIFSTVAITPTPRIPADPNPKLPIIIYNGGAEEGEAKRVSGLFKAEGYQHVDISNLPNTDYQNAIIQFRDTESDQADLAESILIGEYLIVNREPLATDSALMKIILGRQPSPDSTSTDYLKEDLDFFFN